MFCGTTVDLMAKMMTAGRRLVSFWRTHSILEGSGQSHFSRVPLAPGSLLAPGPRSAPGVSPAGPAEHGQLIASLLWGAAYLPKKLGSWAGSRWACSDPLHPHSAPAPAPELTGTSLDIELPKPRSEPLPLGKTDVKRTMVSITAPEQRGWPLFLQQRALL